MIAPEPHRTDRDRATLAALAALLEYPGADVDVRLAAAPAAAAAALAALAAETREELFTATFDVTPACVPYVSIHLFGEENFKRGEFMAALHARYAQVRFDTRGELPDHLAVLLRFAAQTDAAEQRELAAYCLLGPMRRMLEALAADNAYRPVLEAACASLLRLCPDTQPAPSPLEQKQRHEAGAAAGCTGCATHCDRDAEPARI